MAKKRKLRRRRRPVESHQLLRLHLQQVGAVIHGLARHRQGRAGVGQDRDQGQGRGRGRDQIEEDIKSRPRG